MSIKRVSIILYGLALGASQMACIPGQNSGTGDESGSKLEINPPVDPVVCDPFDDDGLAYRQYGLAGKVYYLTSAMPRFNFVSEYIALGQQVPNVTLFLNKLFVPTRPFDRGFTMQDGTTLKTDTGDTLYEWFALQMESQLMINNRNNVEGAYQLALLADDGATLSIQKTPGANYDMLINNDDVHPTRFKVATQPVTFTHASRFPIKLNYFQGPRYHISLILMWRPWPTNPADVMDPLDGFQTNDEFFDSTQTPPTPQPKYQELLNRGWKPLEVDNFLLREIENPCGDDFFL